MTCIAHTVGHSYMQKLDFDVSCSSHMISLSLHTSIYISHKFNGVLGIGCFRNVTVYWFTEWWTFPCIDCV